MKGIIGRKIGMAQIPDEKGSLTSVTLVEIEPNVVLEIKNASSNGKNALVLAAGQRNKERKNMYQNFSCIREIIFESVDGIEKKQAITIDIFSAGDIVNITGTSKGKGFQGVMKRHGFKCNPDSHGHEDHREPGGFGGRTWPGRVSKGRKLPGHMGSDTVTLKKRPVIFIDKDSHILAIKGPLPGSINSFVKIWQ